MKMIVTREGTQWHADGPGVHTYAESLHQLAKRADEAVQVATGDDDAVAQLVLDPASFPAAVSPHGFWRVDMPGVGTGSIESSFGVGGDHSTSRAREHALGLAGTRGW